MTELAEHIPAPLRRPVRAMLAVKGTFVSIASLIMGATFLCVVVLRYGFATDLFAYEEWLLTICLWLYFMGSALGTYENSHVNADLLNYLTDSQRLQWIRSLIVCVIELVVTAFAIYWAILMILDEFASYPYWQTTIALKIPFLVPRFGIVFGFAFMAFYSGLRLYVLIKLQRVPDLEMAGRRGLEADRPSEQGR